MKTALLLGAGFSKNWGGWLAKEAFEYLLGCKEIQDDRQLLNMLWQFQNDGFESVLAALRKESEFFPDGKVKDQLQAFQGAVSGMFDEMNDGFSHITDWDYNLNLTKHFFTRFDQIFSLNQDLLLEQHYMNENVMLLSQGFSSWGGAYLPGMKPITPYERNLSKTFLYPDQKENFVLKERLQPIIKLHGSSNWASQQGDHLLILGGDKESQLSKFDILNWYFDLFKKSLNSITRLMIIGYGFQDPHINTALHNAVRDNNLKIFVISPDGPEQALLMNKSKRYNQIPHDTPLEEMFRSSLIGASRAPLRETFKNLNSAEFNKVCKFFQPG